MDKYGLLIKKERVSEIEAIALNTLELILMEDKANSKSIELFVKIFYKTDSDFLGNGSSRMGLYVKARRLYMFLRYIFCQVNIQVVADEMRCTRANVYHHCQLVFNDLELDDWFKDKISSILDEDTVRILKDRFDNKKRI